MCVESAYYDTCIFLYSLNHQLAEHDMCQHLVDPGRITWTVSFSPELSKAEATIGEYLERFEIECARQGVDLRPMPTATGAAAAKKHLALKKTLNKYGFSGKDWRHLMAAVAAKVQVLVTVDKDYWDPRNKAQPHAGARLERVKNTIESSLPIEVRLPSEFLAGCCA